MQTQYFDDIWIKDGLLTNYKKRHGNKMQLNLDC